VNIQGRILGIDFGTRRVGISISDPLHIIAQSLLTLNNDATVLQAICEIVEREGVGLIVVGMPFNLKGEKASKAQEVEKFIDQLEKAVPVSVLRWDERFTSSLAHDTMVRMGTKRKERLEDKGRIDAMAAAIMLQGFLDSRKRSLSC
jgi:putative Holliday junction resolvase